MDVANPSGRAFCFLPMPIKTSLPFHVNGFFQVLSNRRDIWRSETAGDSRKMWNDALIRDVITACLSRLLTHIAGAVHGFHRAIDMLPIHALSEPWNIVADTLLALLAADDAPKFLCGLHGTGTLYRPSEIMAMCDHPPSSMLTSVWFHVQEFIKAVLTCACCPILCSRFSHVDAKGTVCFKALSMQTSCAAC